MDPIKLFQNQSEILELIFSNLSAQDLLNISLVHSGWYNFVASSKKSMDKIKIEISLTKRNKYDVLEILKNSDRRYRHFEYSLSLIGIDDAFSILPNHQWKSIKITKTTFDLLEDFNDCILKQMYGTVEEIFLDSIQTKSQCQSIPYYKFPALKKLTLKYVSPEIIDVFKECKTLEEIYITSAASTYTRESFEIIVKIFHINTNLRKLSIVTNNISDYFCQDISSLIQFKLEAFEARDIYNLTTKCIENFKFFLHNQMNYLKILDLGDWIAFDIVKMIFHMPNLRELTFKGFHNIESELDLNSIEFYQSESITTLNLIDAFAKIDILKVFILACPNVKRLKLYSIKEDGLKFLCNALPNLRTFSVDILELKSFPNECDFIHLKDFSMKTYDLKLSLSTLSNNNLKNLIEKEMIKIQAESLMY